MSAQGGNKPSYIWTINGTRWFIVETLAKSKILAEMYGTGFTSTWEIPSSQFAAEFTEAKDVPYIDTILDNQPIAGWSPRLLRSDYAGNAINVRRTMPAANMDIGFLDSYGFDVPAFNAFIAASTGFNRIFYDQFNAHNASDLVDLNQPQILPTGASNGRPSINYDGVNCRLPANTLAASYSGNDKPCTFLSVSNPANFVNFPSVLGFGRSTTNTPLYLYRMSNAPEFQFTRRDDTAVLEQLVHGLPVADTPVIYGVMFTGVDLYWLVNDSITKITPANLGNITLNTCTMGGWKGLAFSSLFDGQINEVLAWDMACGLDDFQAAAVNMNQFYAVY